MAVVPLTYTRPSYLPPVLSIVMYSRSMNGRTFGVSHVLPSIDVYTSIVAPTNPTGAALLSIEKYIRPSFAIAQAGSAVAVFVGGSIAGDQVSPPSRDRY